MISLLARKLENYLYLSERKLTPTSYAKRVALGLATIIIILSLSVSFVILFRVWNINPLPISTPIPVDTLVVSIALVSTLGILALIFEPVLAARDHLSKLEQELPYLSSLMTIFSSVGISPHTALMKIGEKGELLPHTSRMVNRIKRTKMLFLLDELECLETEARKIGRQIISDLLFSAAGVVRGGGDIYAVFKDKMRSLFADLRERYRRLGDNMRLMGEVILVLYGVMPLTAFTMFALFASSAVVSQAQLYSLLVNPLMGVAVIFLIDQIYPKSPFKYTKYYITPVYALPLAIAVVFLGNLILEILPISVEKISFIGDSLVAGLALITLLAYPAVKFTSEIRRLNAIDTALPSFIRDITEEIKKGNSPARAIMLVSEERSYGQHLDSILLEIGSAIKIGYTLREAVEIIRSKISWRAALLFESICDGEEMGAKKEIYEEITDTTREITDLVRFAKASTAPLKFFGIATAAMIVGVMIMLVKMILFPIASMASSMQVTSPEIGIVAIQSFSLITEQQLPSVVSSIALGTVINAFILGMLTGKMSEGILAAGYLYAIVTVLLTIVVMIIFM